MQLPENILKIDTGYLLVFVDDELLGMVEVIDFKNGTVLYKEYDEASQQPIAKTKTGRIMLAVNAEFNRVQ